ncbi:bifunctional 3,4-dihydroxy-2-butanone-4-phosphate synthase/GTP cyclohydrolase II [Tuberibacillus sp. Marseille-P3662]|uniref:bifunctional 3,4-dihydroxy-2-butanone-4-phosphate synthase/GTP cyclohydrolase II n=1 Tax=Tuberibacillus sp. Marseille-P3662 TaxID=1965358 RepID=UPI000A1C99C0|nr:bifunctional 3,4-dihydroxy-2-butanone-4-phosphate synthase/GTP cyclohydrolase II [Tuberibacillus sp. Marseille-P3662]
MFNHVEAAIDDLKKGQVVIVCDDEDRENEGDFVAISELATPETINFMIRHGRGLVCAPLSEQKAADLELTPMVGHNSDPQGTAFTVSVDATDSTTGISASERATTVNQLAKKDAKPADFHKPGHIFPLIAKPGGVLRRAGHTEAAVDLARLSGHEPAGVICEIINEDGTMARVPDLKVIADQYDIKMMTIQDLIAYRREKEKLVNREVSVQLPTDFGQFSAVGYTNQLDEKEHVALIKGDIQPDEPVLVRVHSECLTGDVFGSHRCDCGPQLHAALNQIEAEGKGVLLYMRQEGRGIGLMNKLKAYKLQEQGYDTVEANEALGFQADLRDYGIGAQILRDLGIQQMRLLTNNPRKITGIKGYGLKVVDRVPLQIPPRAENQRYMQTKSEKLGHLLHSDKL